MKLIAPITLLLASLATAKDQLKIGKTHSNNCPRRSQSGDQMEMHYRGTLAADGKQFDASYDRNQSFKFKLGAGQVIKGWDQGLQKMCPGDKRKLTIPPHLGYGDRGAGGAIPGGATLIFEVECLSYTDKNGKKYTIDDNVADDAVEDKNEL